MLAVVQRILNYFVVRNYFVPGLVGWLSGTLKMRSRNLSKWPLF